MSAATLPQTLALTPQDAMRLAALVAEVLADASPPEALGRVVAEEERKQKPAFVAALYDQLCYRVEVRDYWLLYRMWKIYRDLGPTWDDAAYLHAAELTRMQPDSSGSGQAFAHMFQILRRRGRDREALDLFRHQMLHLPDQPAAPPEEIATLRAALGAAEGGPPAAPRRVPAACLVHPVFPAERRAPWSPRAHGDHIPFALRPLAEGMTRPAIEVAELADATVLLHHNAVVVLDRDGTLAQDWSVASFPAEIRDWFRRQQTQGRRFETFWADEAVLISDRFPVANICHALYDHLTRLAIYQRLGVDTGQALVIGPEIRLPAQQELLARAGVTAQLGVDRIAEVRVGRLWVSSNCRDLRHAAHLGAPWALDFIHRALGRQGTKGWRRLYLSRADAAARRVVNEAEVMALLEPLGFEAIEPGRMSYAAQIAAFKQASHVIAPHGAGLTHIVLCPPGTRVLEIFHPLYSTAAYAMQAAAAGLDYTAMVARDWDSDAPEWNDPARADVGASRFLERHIRVDLPALSGYLAEVV